MTHDALLDLLDLDAVAAAIRQGAPPDLLSSWDFDALGNALDRACNRWLPEDITKEIIAVESEFTFHASTSSVDGLHGYIDLALRDPSNGEVILVDWKSTQRQLDVAWATRHSLSRQGPLYMIAWQQITGSTPSHFEYRGVREDATRVVVTPYDQHTTDITAYNYALTWKQIRALEALPFWPQHMPQACLAYGRTCEFLEDCSKGSSPPGKPELITLSYSSAKSFQECPERFRRQKLISKEGFSTYEAEWGKAFHRGAAEIYNQVRKLQQDERLPLAA